MKDYLKYASCRICQKVDQDTRDLIDKAIIEGKDEDTIIREFAEYFPSNAPLTPRAIKYHKSHLMEHIAREKINALAISEDGNISISPAVIHSEQITTFLSDTALQVANGVIDEQRVLQALIIDSYKDLNKLNEFLDSQKESLKVLRQVLLTKDSIKRNLADQIQRSQELKIKVGGEISEHLQVQKAIKSMASACIRVLKAMGFAETEAKTFGLRLKAEMEVDPILSPYMN